MSEPLITCVMPTLNRPGLAKHAIDLFMTQTWPNKELIILDDSCQGKQLDYIWDRRIKHVRLMDRMTLADKHDIGNALAQGEYIAYWDDDDWYSNDRLAVQAASMARGNFMCGFYWGYVFFVQSATWGKVSVKTSDLVSWVGNATAATAPGLNFHDGTAMFSRLVNREMIKHGRGAVAEKQSFMVEVALRGFKFECLKNNNNFVYTRHTANYWRPEDAKKVFEPSERPMWFPDSEITAYRQGIP
jgi:glycosyltransferase involved in cell wall biosynthesis